MAKLHHPHAGLLLVKQSKQTMIPLTKDVTTIGRKQADIILDDPKVSGTHAEIHKESGRHILKDLKSTNGTFVNRRPVSSMELTDQDVIEIGITTLCFFSDSREFNGQADEQGAQVKSKSDTVSHSFKSGTVTTSKTLLQNQVTLKIVDGPDKGKSFQFKKSHITIGRNGTDLALTDLDISRSHAMLEVLGKNAIFLRDLGSTNGTFLNGKKVKTEKLQSGDEIVVGNTQIQVTIDGAGETAE